MKGGSKRDKFWTKLHFVYCFLSFLFVCQTIFMFISNAYCALCSVLFVFKKYKYSRDDFEYPTSFPIEQCPMILIRIIASILIMGIPDVKQLKHVYISFGFLLIFFSLLFSIFSAQFPTGKTLRISHGKKKSYLDIRICLTTMYFL